MDIKKQIADELSIPEALIDEAIKSARSSVKIFYINKRNGDPREIFHPSKKLKTIQYWLIYRIFSKMPLHHAAMAYYTGASILNNASAHRANRFFLKMDLENFFPSISFSDFIPILREWHDVEKPSWTLDENTEAIIKMACFYKNDRLAIGYPSSPIISNIVMKEFDSKVSEIISNEKFGKVVYTRYADDMVFSTNKKGACQEIKKEIISQVKITKTPKISVNHTKTKLGSSTGGSASVTGLKICANGHITIHKKQKDHIRLLLNLYKKGKLKEKEQESLLGHLSYIKHVSPDFYTKLSGKYLKEIHALQDL